ncbi:MAG TPA: hypothetical protein VH475_19855 [Tepidisphaeraceae bacterium]|jgi:hypothetical protein
MSAAFAVASSAAVTEKTIVPTTRPSTPPTVVGITVPSLASPASSLAPTKKPLRVLFIGNSYTFFNGGLGTIVQGLASAVKDGRRFEYVEVTKGGQTLEGHWKDGKALAAIRKGGWDYVVLQEHSLRPIQDRERMWKYATMFDAEIHKVGAKTIFYETWARKNKPEMQAMLDAAYSGIAKQVSAMVAPAGLAWERVLKARPTMALHIGDLSHPTPAGTYLNACVFYETFFGKSPEGLPRTIRNAAGKVLIDLSETDATLLQHAAYETCGRNLSAAATASASAPKKPMQ